MVIRELKNKDVNTEFIEDNIPRNPVCASVYM